MSDDVTSVLNAIQTQDSQAAEELLPLVYQELRRLAAVKLADEPEGHTLQATALVHEAFLKLVHEHPVSYQDRRHFFAVAAIAMRRILIDVARSKKTEKRGGHLARQVLPDVPHPMTDARLIALDDALQRLAMQDPVKAQLVELRYFARLTGAQTAQIMGLSTSSVDRMWTFTRAWLQAEIADD